MTNFPGINKTATLAAVQTLLEMKQKAISIQGGIEALIPLADEETAELLKSTRDRALNLADALGTIYSDNAKEAFSDEPTG